MSGHSLGGIPVWESDLVPVGKLIGSEHGLLAHPLDVIAMTHPRAVDRVAPAIAWLLARALRALDRAVQVAPDSGTPDAR